MPGLKSAYADCCVQFLSYDQSILATCEFNRIHSGYIINNLRASSLGAGGAKKGKIERATNKPLFIQFSRSIVLTNVSPAVLYASKRIKCFLNGTFIFDICSSSSKRSSRELMSFTKIFSLLICI